MKNLLKFEVYLEIRTFTKENLQRLFDVVDEIKERYPNSEININVR